jgi:hypothetical protein
MNDVREIALRRLRLRLPLPRGFARDGCHNGGRVLSHLLERVRPQFDAEPLERHLRLDAIAINKQDLPDLSLVGANLVAFFEGHRDLRVLWKWAAIGGRFHHTIIRPKPPAEIGVGSVQTGEKTAPPTD